ncbi:alpha-L-rhamnosidase, partial [Victivallis vadensis]
ALRNGEFYDARLEVPGWTGDRFDDSAWPHAVRIAPPGGEPVEQKQPPCRVLGTFPAVPTGKFDVYDTKQNMAGWARITVEGEAGAEVTLRYAERLTPEGDLSAESQDVFVKSGEFQTDRYILKGGGVEIWEPRFTYHGFQFIKATVSGNAAIRKIEARMVGTAFDSVGRITMSEPDLNRLQAMTRWAYRSNYVGIPTDCPHREKNGWTGDAMLAAETGLFNFDPAASYLEWLQILADNQRPSGQLSGIAPSGGWGFNWGSGPAWDSVLLSMPADIYLHTGDDTAIRCFYDAMKRYLDYCESMATDHIVFFGLGDWCHPDREKMCPVEITSTGYYYMDAQLLSEFARILGRPEDEKRYGMLAEAIKKAFNARFLRKNGRYGTGSGIGEFTATGCALYHDLVPGEYKQPAVEFLAEHARRINCACDFGILGAKYIPRVLAEYGHAELALKFFTRHEFPGWAYWIDLGMTTLGENWTGNNSRNHIMFGDLSAWFYRYLGGFRHEWERPGYRHLRVRPFPVIASCIAEYRGYVSDWKVEDGEFVIQLSVPSGCTATLAMPDGSVFELESGRYQRSCRLP